MKSAKTKLKIKPNQKNPLDLSNNNSQELSEVSNEDQDEETITKNALEEYFKTRIEEIENEFEDIYKKRLEEVTNEYDARIGKYDQEVRNLEAKNERLNADLELNKKSNSKNKQIKIESENSEVDEIFDRNAEENEEIMFRKGLGDSAHKTEEILEKKSIFRDKEKNRRIIPESAVISKDLKNKKQNSKTVQLKIDKPNAESVTKLESIIGELENELKLKNAEIGRFKSSLNIRLKSLADSKKEIEIQIENERASFEQKARIFDSEKSQFLEIQKRLIQENSNLKNKLAKLEQNSSLIQEKLSVDLKNKSRRSLEILHENVCAMKEKVNTAENKTIIEIAKQKKELNSSKAEKQVPNIFSVGQNMNNSIDERGILEIKNKEELENKSVNITDLLISSKKEEIVRIIGHEVIGSTNTARLKSSKLKAFIPQTEEMSQQRTVDQDDSLLAKISVRQRSKSKGNHRAVQPKYFVDKKCKIFSMFEDLYEDDTAKEIKGKKSRFNIEEKIKCDDDLVTEYLEAEYNFYKIHLNQLIKKQVGDLDRQNDFELKLKTKLKLMTTIWREMKTSYAERIDAFNSFMKLKTVQDIAKQMTDFCSFLHSDFEEKKEIYELIQKRDRLKHSIYKAANSLDEFQIFYKRTFHDWKTLRKINEKITHLVDNCGSNQETLYKGIPLHFLAEIDEFEMDYTQKMKIRLDVKTKVAKMQG